MNVRELVRQQGYAVIRSEVLGEEVVITRSVSGGAPDRTAIPEKWKNAVAYSLFELGFLMDETPEVLRQVHRIKRIFDGQVCGKIQRS